jgi:hypothetical protein
LFAKGSTPAWRGLRPCDPAKTKTKTFYEGKTKEPVRPPDGRGRSAVGKTQNKTTLAQTAADAVKQPQVLAPARWPVLK